MEETPEGYYTAMAALCGAKIMNMFDGRMMLVQVHWPYSSDNADEKMNSLYGWGETAEAASQMFLERNGLLP